MRLAYITSDNRGQTDRVLAAAADKLRAQGMCLVGVVQTNIDRPERFHCDMDLAVLPDGPIIRINQDLGPGSVGCRLDPSALETAVEEVTSRLRLGNSDALIINKFGKHEAEGRGFRSVIGEALAQGIPVILGVNSLSRDAFDTFSEGAGVQLAADPEVVADWLCSAPVAAA